MWLLRPGWAGHTRPCQLKHSESLQHPGPPSVGDRWAAGAHRLRRVMGAATEWGPGGHGGPEGWRWPTPVRPARRGSLQSPGGVARAGTPPQGSGPDPQIAPGALCSSLLTIPR